MSLPCAAHSDVAAAFVCDGCGKSLCSRCIEEGHRLLFCRLCGERALPLAERDPRVTPELRRERKLSAVDSPSDALGYCFRGLGVYVYAGYVLVLLLLGLSAAVPGGGLLALLLELLILVILPGLLLQIVRTTAAGETELPDWPDWSELGERLSEVFAFLLILLVALAPLMLLLPLAGCGFVALVGGGWGPGCWLALVAGTAAGISLSLPALGAVALTQNSWRALRVDLHVRTLLAASPDSWKTVAAVTGLYLVSQALGAVLVRIPLLGSLAEAAVGVYATFTGAHLVGLLLRRHSRALVSLYRGAGETR